MTKQSPNLPATASKSSPATLEPTGKVRKAIELMVFEGHQRKDAALAAGIKDKSLYNALAKPHVKHFYNRLLEVLRTSARARNFHRLEEIREQSTNPMAAVNAIKTLESLADTPPLGSSAPRLPGLVFIINQAGTASVVVDQPQSSIIDVTPSDTQSEGIDGSSR